jgi:hypothetical protein
VLNIPRKETRLTGSFAGAWTHLDTLAAVSKVAGIELVPVMDIEISHVNILENERSGSIHNEYPVGWHQNDYPYVCEKNISSENNGKFPDTAKEVVAVSSFSSMSARVNVSVGGEKMRCLSLMKILRS